MRFKLGVLAAFVLFTPAAAADQFDLVCSQSAKGKPPQERRYAIDLSRGVWCQVDKCDRPTVLAGVNQTTIVLSTTSVAGTVVDRVTGALNEYVTISGMTMITFRGACVRAEYTSIPGNAF